MFRFLPSRSNRQFLPFSPALLLTLALGCENDETTPTQPGDTVAPETITTLLVLDRNEESVTLTWRAPGDDQDRGTAETYDMRYATEELTPNVWDRAHLAVAGTPGQGGSRDTTTVTGLERGVTYYFGLKTVDENHNWSPLSNVVSVTTDVGGPYVQLLEGITARTPKWSPNGHQIAYVSGQNIWTVSADGSDREQITTQGAFHPCWSPDGNYIAFVSQRTGRTELWSISSRGGTPFQITHDPPIIHFENPAWSPDGELIAFDAYDNHYRDIYIVPAGGGVPEPWTDERGIDRHPVWSPDGCRLAFLSSRPNSSRPPNIWIGCRDGSSVAQVAGSEWAQPPAWSPDGGRLLFVHVQEVGFTRDQLWWMPTSGGTWVQITREERGEFIEPDWSPDGTRILCAFKARGQSVFELWTVGVE